jgi:hypothetical protein
MPEKKQLTVVGGVPNRIARFESGRERFETRRVQKWCKTPEWVLLLEDSHHVAQSGAVALPLWLG